MVREKFLEAGEDFEIGVSAGVEHFVGEEGGIFVGGDAAIFLFPLLGVDALGFEAFQEGFTGVVATRSGVDAFNDAFLNGFVDRNAVVAPGHGVAVFRDVADEMVEESIDAAMGGDDGELAAPGGAGLGDPVKGALILVEGEFVEGYVAAFARECVWVGREGINAAAIGELEYVGGRFGTGVENGFAKVSGSGMQDVGPMGAVFELKFGLELVAGRDESVKPGVLGTDEQDEAKGIGIGETDLPGFDGDFER